MEFRLTEQTMFKPIFATLISGCLAAVTAAPPSVGTVTSPGDFRVDGATVRGNSTVFDGNTIETSASRSLVALNGAQITLSPESRAKIYRDRTVLEQGTEVVQTDGHVIEAGTLRIAATGKAALLQVE